MYSLLARLYWRRHFLSILIFRKAKIRCANCIATHEGMRKAKEGMPDRKM